MNVDRIIKTLNQHGVDYLLIGGVHFLLRHKPQLTFDVDIWVDDNKKNLLRCEKALNSLNAEWGATERDWDLFPIRSLAGSECNRCSVSPVH